MKIKDKGMEWVKVEKIIVISIVLLAIGGCISWLIFGGQKKSKTIHTRSFEKHLSTFNNRSLKKSERHGFEEVVLQVPEDDKGHVSLRRGELITRSNAPATIILFHGFKCKRSDVRPLRSFMFADYNTLIFDFRAHGVHAHPNECCSFGVDEVKDVKAAVDFVRTHPQLKDKPVIAYGISMGAAAAIEAQSRYDNKLFDALIIDSPFDSMENVVGRGLHNLRYTLLGIDVLLPLRTLLKKAMYSPFVDTILKALLRLVGLDGTPVSTCLKPVSPIESIKNVTVPCLIIGCSQDETTPVEAFESVYENAATDQKELWIVDGHGHLDTFFHKPEEYIHKVRDFLTRIVSDLKVKAWKEWFVGS